MSEPSTPHQSLQPIQNCETFACPPACSGEWPTRVAAARGLVKAGSLTAHRLEELVAGMNEADACPHTLVAGFHSIN